MSEWEKKPAIAGEYGGCLSCGPRPSIFPPDGLIAVGFGCAVLQRGRDVVYDEQSVSDESADYMTSAEAEKLAEADPDHDWQIILYGPLSGRVYQRHGPGEWVLIEQDQGFA